MLAYSGFILVPLGHGTTIQPACAALSGLLLASLVLHEKPTIQRIIGGAIIVVGLLMFGAESLATIGRSGVAGDLLFATAGLFWATFGTLLRLWNVPGTRAVKAVGAVSLIVFAPIYLLIYGISALTHAGSKIFCRPLCRVDLPAHCRSIYSRTPSLRLAADAPPLFPR